MVQEGKMVSGIDFEGNNVQGIVQHIVGFGNVAIIKTGEDRTHKTEAYIENLKEIS